VSGDSATKNPAGGWLNRSLAPDPAAVWPGVWPPAEQINELMRASLMTEITRITRGRVYPAIIVGLLVVIAAMAYKFVIVGNTEPAADGRRAIVVEPGERALILAEMRDFVAGVRKISEALLRDDMAGVASAARGMGHAKSQDVPASLIGKLPREFKTLAYSVHADFDLLAMDAEGLGMTKHTLAQLSAVLQKIYWAWGNYASCGFGDAVMQRPTWIEHYNEHHRHSAL